jgi:GNAT superfamily N-acetyltransferase
MLVKALQSDEEFYRYVSFGQEVYNQNPYWVPPNADHLVSLLSGESPVAAHSKVQAFWVEVDGKVLATLTAVVEDTYNRRWNEHMGHLLFFEALPGYQQAVSELFSTACQWLKAQNCQAARSSLLISWQVPLTIDAYDCVPTFLHTYNPPYYHSYVKNAGFITERGAVQYQVEFTPDLAHRYRQMVEQSSLSGVILRPMDFDRLEEETVLFTEICNDTFSEHWGMQPSTVAGMRGLTFGLKDFLVPEFIVFAEAEGQTIGVVYSLPDLNQAFHKMRGKELENNIEEFQQLLKQIDHGALLIIGVKKQYRGRGVNLALAAKSYLAMIEHGYKTGSYTIVLDDNWRSRRTAERLGAMVTRNSVIYRRELA